MTTNIGTRDLAITHSTGAEEPGDPDILPFDLPDPDESDHEPEPLFPQPAGTFVVQGADPYYLLPDVDRRRER